MEYFIIINGQEYKLPTILEMFNKELFEEYKLEDNEKLYLDIDRLIKDKKVKEIDKICTQCCSFVGELALDSPEDLEEFNKLGSAMRNYDNLAKYHLKHNDEEKAMSSYLSLLEPVLDFYNELMNQDEKTIQR